MGRLTSDESAADASLRRGPEGEDAPEASSKTRELPRVDCGLTVTEPSPEIGIYTVSEPLSHEEFEHYLADLGRRLRDPRAQVVILNFISAEVPPGWQRERQLAWVERNTDQIAARIRGVSVIVPEPHTLAEVDAQLVAAQLPCAHQVGRTLAQSMYFAQKQLRQP